MNEFQYTDCRIIDTLQPDSLLGIFKNTYRFNPETDLSITQPMGGRRYTSLISCDPLILKEIKPRFTQNFTNSDPYQHIFLQHSWEPLELKLDKVFWDIELDNRHAMYKHYNVLHSEKNSVHIKALERSGFNTIHWFSNGYLASEHWYRLYKDITIVTKYKDIKHPWICMNRLIDNKRKYRVEFLNMLDVDLGVYSLLANDPQTKRSVQEIFPENKVQPFSFDNHENSSAWIELDETNPTNTSFLHVVTETVIDRIHLTEKIFKPIVQKHPFVLVGGAGSLNYLKEYGFKTFNNWWSEAYDTVSNSTDRMNTIADIVNWIGTLSLSDLIDLRSEMESVLEYNYYWFYNGFGQKCWQELVNEINSVQGKDLY